MTSACALRALTNPALAGILTGIQRQSGRLSLDRGAFVCCEGRALRSVNSSPQEGPGTAMVACSVRQRFHQVGDLLDRFHLLWGRTSWVEPAAKEEAWILQSLARFTQNRLAGSQKFRPMHSASGKKDPSLLWAVALAATWRFGLRPSIHTLGRGALGSLDGDCDLLLVENVGELWNPSRTFDFESLVAHAYHCQIPLWFELVAHPEKTKEPVGSKFSQRIDALKRRPFDAWLSPSCQSRLEFVCDLSQVQRNQGKRPTGRRPQQHNPSF